MDNTLPKQISCHGIPGSLFDAFLNLENPHHRRASRRDLDLTTTHYKIRVLKAWATSEDFKDAVFFDERGNVLHRNYLKRCIKLLQEGLRK